jgi:hypothetical protein
VLLVTGPVPAVEGEDVSDFKDPFGISSWGPGRRWGRTESNQDTTSDRRQQADETNCPAAYPHVSCPLLIRARRQGTAVRAPLAQLDPPAARRGRGVPVDRREPESPAAAIQKHAGSELSESASRSRSAFSEVMITRRIPSG